MLTELTIKEFIHKVISNDPVPRWRKRIRLQWCFGNLPRRNGCQPDHRTEEIRRSKRSYGRPFRPF